MTNFFFSVTLYHNKGRNRGEREVSIHREVTESCRWWNCSTEQFAEWTFEGGLNILVGLAGNRTRYQSGVYDSTCESGQYVKVSGTAIIRAYYRLRLYNIILYIWDVFFRESNEPCKIVAWNAGCLQHGEAWKCSGTAACSQADFHIYFRFLL